MVPKLQQQISAIQVTPPSCANPGGVGAHTVRLLEATRIIVLLLQPLRLAPDRKFFSCNLLRFFMQQPLAVGGPDHSPRVKTLVSLSLRLKDLLGPVTRVKKKVTQESATRSERDIAMYKLSLRDKVPSLPDSASLKSTPVST